MTDVILLGGSNSVKKNGIRRAFSEEYLKNYALGATSSLQNLYELVRNNENIKESSLIISESNVNDFHLYNILNVSLSDLEINIKRLYRELSVKRCKVMVLILPLQTPNFKGAEKINSIHKKWIEYYGLDYIDIDSYFNDNNLSDFFYFNNLDHPLDDHMYRIGKIIIELFNDLSIKNNIITEENFKIYKDFSIKRNKKNSFFDEEVNIMDDSFQVSIEKGERIIGIHSWCFDSSKLKISSNSTEYIRSANDENQFHDVSSEFLINESFMIESTNEDSSELSIRVKEKKIDIDDAKFGLISLFSVKPCENKKCEINSISKNYSFVLSFINRDMEHIKQYMSYRRANRKLYQILIKNRDNFIISLIYKLKDKISK